MSWPFGSVVAPNLDTGPGADVPTSAGVVTASPAWLLGAHFTNPTGTGTPITVTLTNTAGDVALSVEVPEGGELPFEWGFRPLAGVKWVASDAGLLGQVWGYV